MKHVFPSLLLTVALTGCLVPKPIQTDSDSGSSVGRQTVRETITSFEAEPIEIPASALPQDATVLKHLSRGVNRVALLSSLNERGELCGKGLTEERIEELRKAFMSTFEINYTVYATIDGAQTNLVTVAALPNVMKYTSIASAFKDWNVCAKNAWKLLQVNEGWLVFGTVNASVASKPSPQEILAKVRVK